MAQRLQSAASELLRKHLHMLPADGIIEILSTLDPKILKAALQLGAGPINGSANKRRSPRNRTLRSGKIVYNQNLSVIDCLIRDISPSGCRLRVSNPASVPNGFTLQIVGANLKHSCEVSWRTADELGINFLD